MCCAHSFLVAIETPATQVGALGGSSSVDGLVYLHDTCSAHAQLAVRVSVQRLPRIAGVPAGQKKLLAAVSAAAACMLTMAHIHIFF